MSVIDATWRHAHPLPDIGGGADKDERGRVLVVGGSAFVPGAVRLTAEAALRVGAGKVQVATHRDHVVALGVAMPEASVIALPVDDTGELAGAAGGMLTDHIARCQAVVLGCGTQSRPQTPGLLGHLLKNLGDAAVVIDAGMIEAAGGMLDAVSALKDRVILTPHPGELSAMMDEPRERIETEPDAAARRAAARSGAIVVLKQQRTVIAHPDGTLLTHVSDAPGLGTAGSGDVLAGVIGGLLAREMPPLAAAGWGVWLHGQAGMTAATNVGPLGYLARDLVVALPRLLAS